VVNLLREAPEIVNIRKVTGEAGRLLEIAAAHVAHFHALGPQSSLIPETSPAVVPKSKAERQVMLLVERGVGA
jgi:hypothetical protein